VVTGGGETNDTDREEIKKLRVAKFAIIFALLLALCTTTVSYVIRTYIPFCYFLLPDAAIGHPNFIVFILSSSHHLLIDRCALCLQHKTATRQVLYE
jgi:hypothetical protein